MTVAAETTLYWRIKEAVKASLVTLHEESDPGGLGIGDRVFLADREGKKRSENEPKYLAWRYEVANDFRNARLEGVGEVCGCTVRYQKVFDPQLPMYQYLVSGLVLRFWIAEPRRR